MGIKFINHACSVLPYYKEKGLIHMIFEKKDSEFIPPYFNDGLCFLGGNWEKGIDTEDNSPKDTLIRELNEEFLNMDKKEEPLGRILNQDVDVKKGEGSKEFSALEGSYFIVNSLSENLNDCVSYIVEVNPPVLKEKLISGFSVFPKELSKGDFEKIKKIIDASNGIITTDNEIYGSKTVHTSIDEINSKNFKFVWGYDHILGHLFNNNLMIKKDIVRPLKHSSATFIPGVPENPTYADFEKLGFEYLKKNS